MTRREKLIEKIRARPPEADFRDVRALLEEFEYVERHRKGSHVTFKKPDSPAIVISLVRGRRVKREQLDLICQIHGLDDRS